MFFWQVMITWTILVKGQKERFLPSINEIGPVVSDKKIFKVFYIYRENKPRPLAAMFFSLNIFYSEQFTYTNSTEKHNM